MLDKKPALPANVNPKNVALRLFFKTVLVKKAVNKLIEYEELVSHEQLYRRGNVEIECGKLARVPVKISYRNGFLIVKTSGAVDIHMSGDIPAQAVHIETTGDCIFFNGRFLAPDLKLHVTAAVIACDIPIANAKLIALLPGNKTKNAVLIRKFVATDKLVIDTNDLQLAARLQACKALVTCKQMHSAKHGELIVTGQRYNSTGSQDAFDRMNQLLVTRVNGESRSEITIADELLYEGLLSLAKTKFSCDAPIKFMPGSTANFSFVELAAKNADISEQATIAGSNTIFTLLQNAQINGKVAIDNLRFSAENVDVAKTGVLDGISKLVVTPKQYLTVAGKVTSADTYIDGEYTIARFGGIINGTKTLNISGMFSAALFGGCLSGGRILNRAGLNINLFGIISGWCSSLDSLVGLEFGNLYLPYVDFTNGGQDLYNIACLNLKRLTELPSKKTRDLYNELYSLAPKTTDEAWQVIASKSGIVRTMLSTISISASTVFTFSYQAVALIMQLIRMNNMYALSSFERFTDQSSKEMLMLLLDLKGLMVSGNALHKNAAAGFNSTANTRATPAEALANLASLCMPVVQNDTLFDASAPMLSVSWTETRQNLFSARAGYIAAWSQYEQTMLDQHDHSTRMAHNEALSCGRNRYYNGITKYSGSMSVAATKYDPSATSRIESLGENTQYSLTSDNASLPGVEKHQRAAYAIKNQSVSDAEDLLNGRGKFANIEVAQSIQVSTQSPGNAVIGKFERGPNVAHSLTIPGDIIVAEELGGVALSLKSTGGSIHLQKNIVVQHDLSLEAAKEVIKPSVTAQSTEGNVSVIAGGLLNNNNGGQVIAHNGDVVFIGAKVESRTNGAPQPSLITSRNTLVSATESEVDLLNSITQGTVTTKIQTAGDFSLQPGVSQEWLSTHVMGDVYKGSLVQGGTGTEENGWVGVEFIINGRFNGVASSVQSIGKIIVYARKGFYGETKATVFLAEDRDEKHGWFNTIYYKSEDVKYFEMSFVSGDKIKFICEDGPVNLFGVKHFAPTGTEVLARNQINTDPVTATLHRSETKVKIKTFEKTTESIDGVETVPVFAHTTGITSFTSLEEGIAHNDTLYIGEPGSQFTFTAPKDISTTLNSLNHRILETNVSLKLAAFGQTWIGSNIDLSLMNMVNALDPTGGSAADFIRSSNMPEAMVNGANAMLGISNMLESVMENGIRDAISKQLGGSFTLYKTKKSFDYQAEGQGGFYGGAKINMVSHDGKVVIGVNIYDMSDLYVKAKMLSIINKTLYSKFNAESISITSSVNLAGDFDVRADYQAERGSSTTQMQHYMFIGVLNLDVDHLHIRGTLVRCQDVMGRALVIETEDVNNNSHSIHQHYNASLQGDVGFSYLSSKEESQGAKGQLYVANGINNSTSNLDCQQHINHGEIGILTNDPSTNKLNVRSEQHDQVLKSKHSGGGLSTNISAQGVNRPSKVSVDFLRKHDVVTVDGLQHLKSTKFKASSSVPALRSPAVLATGGDPLNELQTAASARKQAILGEQQYPNSPAHVRSKYGVLQSSPVEVIAKPVDTVPAPSILDEQFLAKPGFEYIQPEKRRSVTTENFDGFVSGTSQLGRTQAHKSEIEDWTSPDSYSDENIRRSIDVFLSDPMNRRSRGDTSHTTKNIALNVAGSIAGLAQVALGDAVEFLDATELPYIMATGASPYGGKKLQKISDQTGQVVNNLYTNGPMPLWASYKEQYQIQMDESLRYANNGNPFMAGFTGTRARAGVALDAASLISLGGAVVKTAPMFHRLGVNAYNVATLGVSRGRTANSMILALEGQVNPSLLSSYKRSAFIPAYDSRRAIINDTGHVNTGARSYNPAKHGFDDEAWAAPIYEDIRSWNCAENIATISKNTGIPEQMIASVRQHVFFNEHRIPKVNRDTGKMTIVTERFSPDAEIASLWDLASSQPISGTDLIKFERLIAHEYVERGLMNIGYPYRSLDPRAIEFVRGDFRLGFNRCYYGAHDMAPLSDYLVSPWQHHKVIGNFEPLPKITSQQRPKVTE